MRANAKRTGSVFADLGFSAAEAENLRLRAAMMRAVVGFVRKREWTPARAAEVLGATHPRVSDLMRGKIHLFSLDNLVNLLAAGLHVDLTVRRVT